MTTIQERTEHVLLDHMRAGIGGCLCGWGSSPSELGLSHTAHVARVLSDEGLLREETEDE